MRGPSEDIWTLGLTVLCSNSFLESRQMLMHEINMCDPIILSTHTGEWTVPNVLYSNKQEESISTQRVKAFLNFFTGAYSLSWSITKEMSSKSMSCVNSTSNRYQQHGFRWLLGGHAATGYQSLAGVCKYKIGW